MKKLLAAIIALGVLLGGTAEKPAEEESNIQKVPGPGGGGGS